MIIPPRPQHMLYTTTAQNLEEVVETATTPINIRCANLCEQPQNLKTGLES